MFLELWSKRSGWESQTGFILLICFFSLIHNRCRNEITPRRHVPYTLSQVLPKKWSKMKTKTWMVLQLLFKNYIKVLIINRKNSKFIIETFGRHHLSQVIKVNITSNGYIDFMYLRCDILSKRYNMALCQKCIVHTRRKHQTNSNWETFHN